MNCTIGVPKFSYTSYSKTADSRQRIGEAALARTLRALPSMT